MWYRYLFVMCGFLVASAGSAVAENRYITRVTLDAQALRAEAGRAAVAGRKFQPIRIDIQNVRGVGDLHALLNQRKLPSAQAYIVRNKERVKDPTVPVLFKGFLLRKLPSAEKQERRQVAVSIIDGSVKLQFRGASRFHRGKSGRVYTVRWKLGTSNSVRAHVASIPSTAFGEKVCATGIPHRSEAKGSQKAKSVKALNTGLYRVLTISTDADQEWYAKYGTQSNAEIAAIVNTAEALYERQLGMRFALVRQHVYADSSPYVSTNASQLLASFAANPENPANLAFSPLTFDQDVDLKHLFTGKNLDGSTVGLSYVGSVCWAPRSAYGVTQDVTRDFNVAIFSHEVGHSLGASHDATDPGNVMYPTLGLNGHFSNQSVEQINRFLSFWGKCVSEQMLRPNIANATLTLKRKRSKRGASLRFYGKLISASQQPLGGEVIKLTINDREKFVRTDEAGIFTYTLKTSRVRVKKIVVSAQPVGNEVVMPGAVRITTRV